MDEIHSDYWVMAEVSPFSEIDFPPLSFSLKVECPNFRLLSRLSLQPCHGHAVKWRCGSAMGEPKVVARDHCELRAWLW